MQTNSNSQMGNPLNANSGGSIMGYMRSSPKTCQLLFHCNICGQMLLQVVIFHPTPAIWKIEGCAQASVGVAPYRHHCRVQRSC